MSGCLCGRNDEGQQMLAFWAEDMGEPVEFAAPSWAIKLPQGDALHREPTSFHSAQWWMENRNDYDDLWDEEFVRDELVRLAVGYFDWLKNSFTGREATVNYRLIKLPLHNSKRGKSPDRRRLYVNRKGLSGGRHPSRYRHLYRMDAGCPPSSGNVFRKRRPLPP